MQVSASTPSSDGGERPSSAPPLRRTARACDSCHRRKIQCEAPIPCNWCRHHNLDCTFNRPIGGSKRKRATNEPTAQPSPGEDLEDKVMKLEQLLVRSMPTNEHQRNCTALISHGSWPADPVASFSPQRSSTNGPPPGEFMPRLSPGLCFGKIHFAGHYVGDLNAYNGIPSFSVDGQEWVQSRTGEDKRFNSLQPSQPQQSTPQLASSFSNTLHGYAGILDLPDRSVVDQYVRRFFSSFIRFIFPLIDSLLFKETVDLAYAPYQDPPTVEITSAKACVMAFLALMSMILRPQDNLPALDTDVYAVKAQNLLPQLMDDVSLSTFQTMLMLTMNRVFSGQLQAANQCHAMSCRVMFSLGAQLLPNERPAPPSPLDIDDRVWRYHKQLRNLFWLCYTHDKEICLRSGQPPIIDDEHCNLSLPVGYMQMQYREDEGADRSMFDDIGIPHSPADLRMTVIKSKVYRALYSSKSLLKSDAQLLQDIRELDDELERWRLDIPPKFRPSLGHSFQSHENPFLRMQAIVSRFEYHYLMVTIHRAAGRCQSWANSDAGVMEGINSSMLLAVEASRSTLLFLRPTITSIFPEAFWMITFYPMSAILTIFCNILLFPLDPRVEEDLKLLGSVPDLIKGFRPKRLTSNEAAHFTMVADFVAELKRLGNCAIRKARYSVSPR
ncbi:Zn(II)2Cys6 transcription factor [Aspergillus saccharolyticus JOP 1030-1]|uniref:Zn(2)-C6 fungal-type domain-containing protein n=1 Tax=Aspergillus saccharolyticus JOP 1030-1 TaxID=1450539 RepID=A0A318ZHI9_9EURO|nr:hypothetical protein BP01DRAFT_292534 [Aspergillus saccharolyticus JOP 1030-1]PYH47041.1 hypothetical protein BP01DRAFT_292534 [Aspergillus saccharolyticus JOP 1030-1]